MGGPAGTGRKASAAARSATVTRFPSGSVRGRWSATFSQKLVGDVLAELVEQVLGPRGCHFVGKAAPPPLRSNVVRFLHDALAVAAPRWAGPDPDTEVFRDRRVAAGDLSRPGVHHGGHPIEPPVVGDPAELARDVVLGVDQVRLVHRFAELPTPFRRVRQRPHQQVGPFTVTVPMLGRIGQLHPIPLGFRTRRVLDDRRGAAFRGMARLARWPQGPHPQRPRERRIRARVAQLHDLVKKRRRPHMRVLTQPRRAVVGEPGEHVRPGRGALTDPPAALQIGPDRFAVPPDMPGDRRNRPPRFRSA